MHRTTMRRAGTRRDTSATAASAAARLTRAVATTAVLVVVLASPAAADADAAAPARATGWGGASVSSEEGGRSLAATEDLTGNTVQTPAGSSLAASAVALGGLAVLLGSGLRRRLDRRGCPPSVRAQSLPSVRLDHVVS